MGKFLGDIHGFHLTDEDLGAPRHINSRKLSDLVRALAYDLGVQRAVDQDGLADLVQLVTL